MTLGLNCPYSDFSHWSKDIAAKNWNLTDVAREKDRLSELEAEYVEALNRADPSVFERKHPDLFWRHRASLNTNQRTGPYGFWKQKAVPYPYPGNSSLMCSCNFISRDKQSYMGCNRCNRFISLFLSAAIKVAQSCFSSTRASFFMDIKIVFSMLTNSTNRS